ncbi:hypothetical protein DVU_3060 [Nitratidesulfovibrio vulgaris str. Hildenborough]|uniref:Uncharacterized protein n=1 Tax=Nitratidesulfovibrio vulgaris (strain ATCC 29579 / DSM 644 / CCUG 34227 / NCIMB 8303 / VKM B-1760 / Hildenborough) TaxID=882 RepID=Q726P6_NITV2|nr:hypothetical protein DVU_3060 [Nitratidesulfovibrio vulgaris str. Hildenborough]
MVLYTMSRYMKSDNSGMLDVLLQIRNYDCPRVHVYGRLSMNVSTGKYAWVSSLP